MLLLSLRQPLTQLIRQGQWMRDRKKNKKPNPNDDPAVMMVSGRCEIDRAKQQVTQQSHHHPHEGVILIEYHTRITWRNRDYLVKMMIISCV